MPRRPGSTSTRAGSTSSSARPCTTSTPRTRSTAPPGRSQPSRRVEVVQRIDRATVWPYDEQGRPQEFVYQRYGHPTGAAAEAALGALEGGVAVLFGSGTAAVTAC